MQHLLCQELLDCSTQSHQWWPVSTGSCSSGQTSFLVQIRNSQSLDQHEDFSFSVTFSSGCSFCCLKQVSSQMVCPLYYSEERVLAENLFPFTSETGMLFRE
ncbi:hypothetical protein AMECASPLE_011242 [Ameca splendens]|uniref:Uncharacterized protein n=1 Tax=Ameca splendens TaxID=208324 RepID=A0ABV0ZLN3_9TELE